MADDPLSDFERDEFTHGTRTRTVFRRGEGPAVVVIAEMPGITPKVADFARRVSDMGCTAVMPHLFGTPGLDPNAHGTAAGLKTMASSFVPACVSREFTVLATGRTSPVVDWLRALAEREHDRCGGPGVGAVGMCWTGGYALAMAADDRLLAPVLSQPSMPLGISRSRRRSLDISDRDLAKVRNRCAHDNLEVVGLRFTSDRLVPGERFEFLREQLGDAFIGIELDGSTANPEAQIPPHSVLTEHLIDEPGEPTHDALMTVLEHLRGRLLEPAS
ncbi:MAG: dienelactone hydrolase family protein [Microthrixaceae bacterium]